MPYAPIDSYGLIGNMKTAALVGRDGSIDWLCLPHFDSPSIFAAILDDSKGGCFRLQPADADAQSRQFYWPDTNVLVSRLMTNEGIAERIDFMPVDLARHDHLQIDLIRIVRVEHGRMTFKVMCQPAMDYGRAKQQLEISDPNAVFTSDNTRMYLSSTVPLQRDDQAAVGEFTLREGEAAAFAIRLLDKNDDNDDTARQVTAAEAEELREDTVDYWRQWISHCNYTGRWREEVRRSALALKLMTFEPTGAIVAAPTTSLPEHIGGTRNWDYRFTWLRDAAFTIYALLHIGFRQEAADFMNWLQDRSHEQEEDRLLLPVYGIDGRHELPEETLDHFEGYRGSGPVRIGNGAVSQLQMDVSGALIDAAYVFDRDAVPISHQLWVELRKIANWICRNWQRSDHGVWEFRHHEHHFVYSKLMCWVALDRAMRISQTRSLPGEIEGWRKCRDMIYDEIMTRGWNEQRGAFVQRYDDDALDAANLIMPLIQFASPNDPRILRTIDTINQPLWKGGLVSDFVVHRYDTNVVDDGVGGPEGGFTMCTFWMVQALTLAGRFDRGCLEQARNVFERCLRHGGDLGLFAEQIGVRGEALGNYPQGLTHLSLIIAAEQLDRALGE